MSILTTTQYWAKKKQEWADESKQALNLVMDLPAEIQNLEGSADLTGSGEKLKLELWQSDKYDIMQVLKNHGAVISTPEISGYLSDYYANGTMFLGNIEVEISIFGLDAPEGCRVESYTEEVTRYRSVCEDEQAKEEVEAEVS